MANLIVRQKGSIGYVTLNRPEALNALTHQMCLDLEKALNDWAKDDSIAGVYLDGAGDRAFCAGGDITRLYQEGLAGNHVFGRQFWQDEYRLNALIANYPKPYVSILDGIVMGGGVGISLHGSHRIVTDKTMFAMPECSIGLIPDVGGSLLLANTPGSCGEYLGLTGSRLGAADCLYAGLADYYVAALDIEKARDAFFESGDPSVFENFASDAGASDLSAFQEKIDAVFSASDLSGIHEMLRSSDDEWHAKTLKSLNRAAPLSALVALEVIRKARHVDGIEAALVQEYRFVSRCSEHSEFLEGIRAAVIDKDRNPQWKYESHEDVPSELVELMLAPAENGDITF